MGQVTSEQHPVGRDYNSFAFLAKRAADDLEGIGSGPWEALRAAGA